MNKFGLISIAITSAVSAVSLCSCDDSKVIIISEDCSNGGECSDVTTTSFDMTLANFEIEN